MYSNSAQDAQGYLGMLETIYAIKERPEAPVWQAERSSKAIRYLTRPASSHWYCILDNVFFKLVMIYQLYALMQSCLSNGNLGDRGVCSRVNLEVATRYSVKFARTSMMNIVNHVRWREGWSLQALPHTLAATVALIHQP